MATTITRFGGKIIEPARGFAVITGVLRAFFDEQFGRRPPGSFLKAAASYPQVELRETGKLRATSRVK